MKIKEITNQLRRDFSAKLVCQHCGHVQMLHGGYDDDNYHRNVIPKIECDVCGKVAPARSRPMGTKYAAHEVV